VPLRPRERLLPPIGAVRVDVQLDVAADRLARGIEARGIATLVPPHFHLHARNAGRGPVAELLLEPVVRVRAEAAAPVDRDARVRSTEQVDERHAEAACLAVPQ